MSINKPFADLEINRAISGFYAGHSVEIALLSKAITVALVIWALIWPANANGVLGSLNWLQSRTQYHLCYQFSRAASASAEPTIGDAKYPTKLCERSGQNPSVCTSTS